jgi:protein-S-isoprenylcysteine O-methyltransferase Ste14
MANGSPTSAANPRDLKRDIEDLAGRSFLLLWFGAVVVAQLIQLINHLSANSDSLSALLSVSYCVLAVAFSGLSVALTALRRPSRAVAAGWEPRISAILGTFLILTITFLPPVTMEPSIKVVALTIILVGLVLSVYCLSWLGKSYSVMATARKLVTGGPYRFVRHPLYAAEFLMMLGITIANFSPAAVLIFLAALCFQLRRAVNEEGILRAAFPEYEQYAREVPRIIPRLPWTRRVVGTPVQTADLVLKPR